MGCIFSPSFAVRSRQQSLGVGSGEGSGEGGEGLFQVKGNLFFFLYLLLLRVSCSMQDPRCAVWASLIYGAQSQ